MKSLKLIFSGLFIFSFMASGQEAFVSDQLNKVWEVNQGLDVPESAHFNKHDQTIYVSNIVGKHDVKDGKGYISKVSADGEMIEKEFISGLNAPKGVYCSKDKLYVADIDEVLEYDLKTGKKLNTYKNKKSKGLNDVTIGSDGKPYITDSAGKCLFVVENNELAVYIEDDQLKGMNGVYAGNNKLYIGGTNNFHEIDQTDKSISIVAEEVGTLDGIEKVGEGTFVTSDWKGHVQKINTNGETETLLNTTSDEIYAADLGFIPDKKLLLVPTFYDNRVVAYELNSKAANL